MTYKILIVDPNEWIAENILLLLREANYDGEICVSGRECQNYIQNVTYDLIVTEIALPDISADAYYRMLTRNGGFSRIPIVIHSMLGSELDKVIGLSNGATDYIVKPICNEELLWRLKAILRRTAHATTPVIHSNNVIQINTQNHRCQVDGVMLELTPIQFRILSELVGAEGRVMTREEIIDAVWGDEAHVTYRTVDATVREIRKKLRNAKDELETVRGVGYRICQHMESHRV